MSAWDEALPADLITPFGCADHLLRLCFSRKSESCCPWNAVRRFVFRLSSVLCPTHLKRSRIARAYLTCFTMRVRTEECHRRLLMSFARGL
jgi:hypothetical protein